jgi:pimeloyl-ACP methyl ester carboxylesterase
MRKGQYLSRQISCHTMESFPVLTADVNGITLAYQDRGSGSPLVLINGFASTMDMWSPPVLAALADHFRIIIFDHRGTGYSSASDDPFSIPLFASDTLALMDALGISRAHILGLSMGASVAQEIVLSRPERVDRLILVAGTCGGSEAVRMAPEIWETLSDKSGSGLDLANRMFSVLFTKDWLAAHDPWQYCPEVRETTSEESAARQANAFYTWPGSYDRLPQIRLPTLVVTGTNDVVIPPANAVTLSERIHGARLVQFPGAGHGLMYQCPDEFAKFVRVFLGNLS